MLNDLHEMFANTMVETKKTNITKVYFHLSK